MVAAGFGKIDLEALRRPVADELSHIVQLAPRGDPRFFPALAPLDEGIAAGPAGVRRNVGRPSMVVQAQQEVPVRDGVQGDLDRIVADLGATDCGARGRRQPV
jgi:hypothetical protein